MLTFQRQRSLIVLRLERRCRGGGPVSGLGWRDTLVQHTHEIEKFERRELRGYEIYGERCWKHWRFGRKRDYYSATSGGCGY